MLFHICRPVNFNVFSTNFYFFHSKLLALASPYLSYVQFARLNQITTISVPFLFNLVLFSLIQISLKVFCFQLASIIVLTLLPLEVIYFLQLGRSFYVRFNLLYRQTHKILGSSLYLYFPSFWTWFLSINCLFNRPLNFCFFVYPCHMWIRKANVKQVLENDDFRCNTYLSVDLTIFFSGFVFEIIDGFKFITPKCLYD